MSSITAVIFDYGGVISTPLTPALVAAAPVLGITPTELARLLFGSEAIENPLGGDVVDGADDPTNHVTHDWHRLEVGAISFAEYVDGVRLRAQSIGIEFSDDALAQFLAALAPGTHWEVVHEARRLRDRGVQLALLTNNVREFGSTWRATFPVEELFPVVVDSCEVGMRKPDPEIYALTCAQICVEPEQAIFVDDNTSNVMAASALGMRTVHFRTPTQALADLRILLET